MSFIGSKTLALAALAIGLVCQPAKAVLVTYTGTGADAGLNATADFTLLNSGNTLQIVLTNTSNGTFGGVNGDASMVLSSLNFDLGGVNITGGSVALNGTSTVVTSYNPPGPPPAVWADVNPQPTINSQYGYSNTGVGNSGGNSIVTALSAVTSHNNGGNAVTSFTGGSGLPGGGLNYGLVAQGSTTFGNSYFIMDSIVITLNLSSALSDLSFLDDGTYVEFGSDHAYVPGEPEDDDDDEPVVPEPATLAMIGIGLSAAGLLRRRQS